MANALQLKTKKMTSVAGKKRTTVVRRLSVLDPRKAITPISLVDNRQSAQQSKQPKINVQTLDKMETNKDLNMLPIGEGSEEHIKRIDDLMLEKDNLKNEV